jgi:TPR repeat protein
VKMLSARAWVCVLVQSLAISSVGCSRLAVSEAESALGETLHARKAKFDVTASSQPVDPRVADAVNAAIEQAVATRGLYSPIALEPLAYAVVVQTGAAPALMRTCLKHGGCCTLLCRVMRSDARWVMAETLSDFDKEFRVSIDNGETIGGPASSCPKNALPERLECLRAWLSPDSSNVKLGPFLVRGRIRPLMAGAFRVEEQISSAERTIRGNQEREERKAPLLSRSAQERALVLENQVRGCGNTAPQEASSAHSKLDVSELQESCSKNDPAACVQLGEMFETGSGGVAKDEERAIGLFKVSCDRGSIPGCGCLGRMYLNTSGASLPKNPEKARPLLERACQNGYPRGCRGLGSIYFEGMGVAVDKDLAARTWAKGCDGCDMGSCAKLAVIVENGDGVPKDDARAFELYQQACSSGIQPACNNLGLFFLRGSAAVPKDVGRARTLFEHACLNGLIDGCFNLGLVYANGPVEIRDPRNAVLYFEKACESGDANGCCNAVVVSERFGRDANKREPLARKACKLGSQQCCEILLREYPANDDVPKRGVPRKKRPPQSSEKRMLQDRLLGP